MSWKLALTVGVLLAQPVIKSVQAWSAERAARKEFYREIGDCGVSLEELKALAWENDEELDAILNQKGLNAEQKAVALSYVDGYRISELKRDEMHKEFGKSKDWISAHYSIREDREKE